MDLLVDRLGQFGWNDLIEVTIITYLFYRLLLLLRRTQAMRMVWGSVSYTHLTLPRILLV